MSSDSIAAAGDRAAAGLSESWRQRIRQARDRAVEALWRERRDGAGWEGELSASALSTATAITALALVARAAPEANAARRERIRRGVAWLVAHQNADGGWGDTTASFSNVSTTTLVWAALGLEEARGPEVAAALAAAERWLQRAAGSVAPAPLVAAIERRYGRDRTFSIPILTLCAVCGRLGTGREAWRRVRQLPFEVAALPQRWFGALQLPVVSYALPALIAIGQVRHAQCPTANPVLRRLRDGCRDRTLATLARLQPENGGFLEATPLTSFVVLSLAAAGLAAHPVVTRGVAFLEGAVRPDGSWPIDTNLATWLTTLAVAALSAGAGSPRLRASDGAGIRAWILRQQYRTEHPYTLARAGGWAWTDLPGGVPDADDTAGALLALAQLGSNDAAGQDATVAGVRWLLDLQNRDGGIPTFCRGWGRLPFDRSSPDITAHALRAWVAALPQLAAEDQERVRRALRRASAFLRRTQRADGAWIPLWFGHQEDPADESPLYGTARVVPALCAGEAIDPGAMAPALERAVQWLLERQNADGGWSGAAGAMSTWEETGLAVEALSAAGEWAGIALETGRAVRRALERGGDWLAAAIAQPGPPPPAPIGFYFAKLWYFERLYPLVFATGALNRLAELK